MRLSPVVRTCLAGEDPCTFTDEADGAAPVPDFPSQPSL